MNTEAQRAAIAKACPNWRVGDESGMSALVHWTDSSGTQMLSDPLSDLNAMHEAEKVLTDPQTMLMRNWLEEIAERPGAFPGGVDFSKVKPRFWQAAADQRAEAFLRTLNLWTES